jgi:hypothetical protein
VVLYAFIVILATYLVAYWRASRHGFSRAGLNALVISSGAILLLMPVAGLGIWYFMIRDWPMNIGGKPNWAWNENTPAPSNHVAEWTLEHIGALGTAVRILFATILLSYVYGCIRMRKAVRALSHGVDRELT